MGWPRKEERLRLYFERKAKTYLLIDVDSKKERPDCNYDAIGELMIDNDPEKPCLCTTAASDDHLYRHCRRVAWNEMPEIWQKAFANYLTDPPEKYRGLWRHNEPVESRERG